MAEGYDGRAKEQELKNLHARRCHWCQRDWRISSNGNPYLNLNGYNIVVFPKGDGFNWRIARGDKCIRFGDGPYASEDAAKLRLFDYLAAHHML